MGDIIVEKNDIYGDHVNIAARLEQLAEPGGILISGSAHDYVRNRIACHFEDTGLRQFKNIARPIQAFAISPAGANGARAATAVARPSSPLQAGAEKATTAKLQLFGSVSLHIGEQEIALRSLKSRALLGYLALTPDDARIARTAGRPVLEQVERVPGARGAAPGRARAQGPDRPGQRRQLQSSGRTRSASGPTPSTST